MKLLFLSLFPAVLALAQSFQGTLRGRVSDPSGSSGRAIVELVDESTSGSRKTVTNDVGEYTFAALTPSTYTVRVESTGFKKVERRGVTIATQAVVTLDLVLELGELSEQVNVTEDAPPLQTGDASTGQVIDRQKITDLPLLGRNTFFTAKLAQAVVFVGNPKFTRMQDQNGNSQVSIAGGPIRTNSYLVDGISITDSTNRAVILPSPEAVQELKLQASTYDAEVGRTGGGVFNTLLRFGSNELHGSAVGHIRDTSWLANTFFANRSGQAIAEQPFKDWAGSLGGPILIPKLYDGRNRTFFFITTEAYRQTDGSTTSLSVPTPLERAGNFSRSFTRTGALQTIYDPSSTILSGSAAGLRTTPFPNNVIPASQLSPAGLAISSYYPDPNSTTGYYGAPNYSVTGGYPNRGDQSTWKADHQFTNWLRASGSYIHQKTFEIGTPTLFPNAADPGQNRCCDRKIDATQANAILTPDATTVVALRWGFNRFYSKSTQASAGFNLTALGFPQSLARVTSNTAFPAITNSDFSALGGGGTSQDVYYSRSFNATASKSLGRHSVKAGFDFRALHDAGTPVSGPSSFTFSDVFTRLNASVATTGTGSSLATLLLGFPTGGSQTIVSNFDDYVRYYGGFIQDDFRISSKLTLNFGLRFEYESGIREKNHRLIVGFDPTVTNPIQQNVTGIAVPGQVLYAGVDGNPLETGRSLSVKPAPRFGFAYAPDSATVIRGGYGIFWAPTFFTFQNAIGYSSTTSIVASINGNFTPAATLSNPYPNGLIQPTGNSLRGLSGIGQPITVFDPGAESSGYVQQYSFEIQRKTLAGFVATAGFLGSHSLHLLENGQNVNQLSPSYFSLGSALAASVDNPFYNNGGTGTVGTARVSRAQLLLPFPQYTSVALSNSATGKSGYYSFYVRMERKFSQGLSLLASYTWSRSTDNIFGLNTAGTSQVSTISGPQNAYNLNAEWSLSTQDVPNRFTTAITYELPLGRNQRFLDRGRILDLFVGGWAVNTLGTMQTGYPLAISQTNNNSAIGGSSQRPNATGATVATTGSTTERIDGWLNSAAFSQSAAYTFGNVSRFINARGPSLFNWDLSVFKTFTVTERTKAQFRAEAFNVTNTPYFGSPNTNINSATFGVITSQINNPRMIQLGLRITF